MKKILRYFPLNKKMAYGKISSLLKVLGIYWGTIIATLIIDSFTDRIPLIRNLMAHVLNSYIYYALAGNIVSVIQFITKIEQEEIHYFTLEDVKALWSINKVRKGVLIAVAVLCIVPVNSRNNYQPSVKENLSEESFVENTDVDNTMEENKEDLTETFYSYVKGSYQEGSLYYTFSRMGEKYYFIICDESLEGTDSDLYDYVSFYTVESLECNDNFFEASLYSLGDYHTVKGNLKDGKCTDLVFVEGDKALQNISLSSFDELLDKEEYASCYRLSYYLNEERDIEEIKMFDYKKEDIVASYIYDISSETEGDELILERKVDDYTRYTVLGLKDGVVIPLYNANSYNYKAVYDSNKNIFWLHGTSETELTSEEVLSQTENKREILNHLGYFYMDYLPERNTYYRREATETDVAELKKFNLKPLEEMELCDRLIFELANADIFPEGYSSEKWDNLTIYFDGKPVTLGKTMFDEFYPAENWEDTSLIRWSSATLFDHSPDYKSMRTSLEHKMSTHHIDSTDDTYELTMQFDVYDVREGSIGDTNKTIYGFNHYCFTTIPEDRQQYPDVKFMGNISYESTYEEVYEAYGMPTYVSRSTWIDSHSKSCYFCYYSEDYTKILTIEFDSNGKIEDIEMEDRSWFQDKSILSEGKEEQIRKIRMSNYERLQERRQPD